MLTDDLKFKFNDYFDGGKLIKPLRVEGHAHTDFTDGRSSAEDCTARAVELGLETLVFAEHVHRGAPWFEPYMKEAGRLKALHEGKLNIIRGIETRALNTDGALDADDDMLERAELVVGSVHGLPPWGDSPIDLLHVPTKREKLDVEMKLLLALAGNPAVDVIGHPFGSYFEPHGPPPEEYLFRLLDAANAGGKAVEINAAHTDVAWFLARAVEYGKDFLFWLASDAHYARDVGRVLEKLVDISR